MRTRIGLPVVILCWLVSASFARGGPIAAVEIPAQLTDQEFWKLVDDVSEPDGFFDSDNLISNEDSYQAVIPRLRQLVKPGGVYLGVGPDQNFTYIVALEPRMAFITDVRRGNLHVHLMYKAIIEQSADRAEFLSRLFSRRRPSGLAATETTGQLFRAFMSAAPDQALYDTNLRAIVSRLTKDHGFVMSASDLAGVAYVYRSFFVGGPSLTFVSSRPGNRYPTYEQLMTATDDSGVNWGYLGSDPQFQRLKAMEQHNAIVPLVGNFAGPRALRAIGAYVKAHGGTIAAFYTSNVEQYLFQDRIFDDFVSNLAALPVTDASTMIRSCFNTCSPPAGLRSRTLLDSLGAVVKDAAAGRLDSYQDLLGHSTR